MDRAIEIFVDVVCTIAEAIVLAAFILAVLVVAYGWSIGAIR
jgi:hypothetical protein